MSNSELAFIICAKSQQMNNKWKLDTEQLEANVQYEGERCEVIHILRDVFQSL